MVDLVPIPFGVLITRLFRELDRKRSAFDLPVQRFVQGDNRRDLSVLCHGRRASTPLGPAAGPHTQMAQNIVLSWLAGGRIIEFKTVQIKDDLRVPRPCIDVQTVGFNVEWSQELTLDQSREEYVKAAMLIEMLKASGVVRDLGDTVFDMSIGYDLAGIRSDKMHAFMAGLLDATPVVEKLRAQIPEAWKDFRDLSYPRRLSTTLTLSTFHGCPPDEIERIAAFLLEEIGLDVVIKLNPTLLGAKRLREILNDQLGYSELAVPDAAFEQDAGWEQVVDFVGRLDERARRLCRGFGVKFSNTLVVRNHKTFFPASEQQMYLSGPPLHPLAVALVRRFRSTFADRIPISFSAGIDDENFADAVGLGLAPVTVCTDLLKPGGYRRGYRYIAALIERMNKAGAADIDTFAIAAHGQAEAALDTLNLPPERTAACRAALAEKTDLRTAAKEAFPAWVSAARLLNTEVYADRVLGETRYSAAANSMPPKKIGRHLALFDCYTCDKCIPVCPNDANFSFVVPKGALRVEQLSPGPHGWTIATGTATTIAKPRQFATFADACNECGNCDVQCPEDGGPYLVKPLFFGSLDSWTAAPERDGFVVERLANGFRMHGRFAGRAVRMETGHGGVRYSGAGFDLRLDLSDPAGTADGAADGPVDLTPLRIMDQLLHAVTAAGAVNFVTAAIEHSAN
ncbi:MAG: hypothetical protein U1E81_02395 [Xanthobacteraceae bacterium]